MSAKARVLAALQDGPKTTAELCQPEVGGVRFGARLAELRHDEGHNITEERLRAGSSLYTLQLSPAARPGGDSLPPPPSHPPAAGLSRRKERVWSFINGERREWIRTECPPDGRLPHVDSLAQQELRAA